MDLEYFKNKIRDETDGAKEYIQKAIETKPINLEQAKIFQQMAETENDHALKLYTMFNAYSDKLCSRMREVPQYITELINEIRETYNNGTERYAIFLDAYKKS